MTIQFETFPFERGVIQQSVLTETFKRTGICYGQHKQIHYAVIDVRRRSLHVWQKFDVLAADLGLDSAWLRMSPISPIRQLRNYAASGLLGGHGFFTNGPFMRPPTSSIGFPRWFRMAATIASALLRNRSPGEDWSPMGRVISGGRIVHPGSGALPQAGYIRRNGQGRFSNYSIGPGGLSLAADEGMAGLTIVVDQGRLVKGAGLNHVKRRRGVAGWALVPLPMALDTTGWETEVEYLDPGDGGPPNNETLEGVLVAAGSATGRANQLLPESFHDIGATGAVVCDLDDSVLCGADRYLFADCSMPKDSIQLWGLGVT